MMKLNRSLTLDIEYFKQNIEPSMDICIVGGGITGLLYAFKLRKKYPYLKICILEKSNTLGGALSTRIENDFVLDFGGMLFECGLLKNFIELANVVYIDLEQFLPQHCVQELNIHKLNEDEKREILNNIDKNKLIVLLKYVLKIILKNQWNFAGDVYDANQKFKLNLIRQFGKFQGKLLSEQSIFDILKSILSTPALEFILASLPPHLCCRQDSNAAIFICYLLTYLNTYDFIHIRPKQGSYSLIEKLTNHIKTNICILLNHTVYSISQYNKNSQKLCIYASDGAKNFYAKKVVFCTNFNSFLKINGIPPLVKNALKCNYYMWHIYHLFVICKNPPWHETCSHACSEFPNTIIKTKFNKNDGTGLMEVSGNSNTLDYWKGNLKDKILKLIQLLYPKWNEPEIIKVVLHTDNQMTSDTFHELRKDFQISAIQDVALQFSLLPDGDKCTYLCSPPLSPEITSIEKIIDIVNISFNIVKNSLDNDEKNKRLSLDVARVDKSFTF